jgi:tetratricopeptide (TPR) repeat protein
MVFPLIALAAALLVTGCVDGKKEQNTPSPQPKPNPEQIPDPSPTFPKLFGNDTVVKDVYQDLRRLGVTDSQLDRGCNVMKYQSATPQMVKLFEGNKTNEACEIYEYALDQHYAFTKFNNKGDYLDPVNQAAYANIVKRFSKSAIPWSLDDNDPSTDFDKIIRDKIFNQIGIIKDILAQQNIQPDSEDYNEKLAIGLWALVCLPPFPVKELFNNLNLFPESHERKVKETISRSEQELKKNGLENYWELLSEKGGMGLLNDEGVEMTALEALSKSQGNCTELSKILFAVFRMVNLDPQFMWVDPTKSKDPWLAAAIEEQPSYDHVDVALKFHGRWRQFDAAMIDPDAQNPESIPACLRQFLSEDFQNRGINLPNQWEIFTQALQIDENNTSARNGRALLLYRQGKYSEAQREAQISLDTNPKDSRTWDLMGTILKDQGEYGKSLSCFDKSIELNKSFSFPYYNRGAVLQKLKKPDLALKDFSKAYELSPTVFILNKTGMVRYILSETQGKEFEKEWRDFFTLAERKIITEEIITQEEKNKGPMLFIEMKIISTLWEKEKVQESAKFFAEVLKIIKYSQSKLHEKQKDFSPPTIKFIRHLFNKLPSRMQNHPAIQRIWDSLKLDFIKGISPHLLPLYFKESK